MAGPMINPVSQESAPRRRSVRIVMRIPLLVNLAEGPLQTDWESVETIMVSLHGAMIRARQEFPVGTRLDIRVRTNSRSALARVVWKSPQPTGQGRELSFEILDQPGFWEINFPPDRWSDQTRPRTRRS